MKRMQILGFSMSFILFWQTNADSINNLNFAGNVKVSQENYQSINVNGDLDAERITNSGMSNISGKAQFRQSKLQDLSIDGKAILENSQVNGEMNISGALAISNSQISGKLLHCSGSLTSNNSTYALPINISGSLDSNRDSFYQTINTSGSITLNQATLHQGISSSGYKLKLTNSQIKGDITDNAKIWILTPQIFLDNTQVTGNIVFTKMMGELILANGAKVTGTVKNAKIVRYGS
ncbi:MAG TPA: hypothetical protein PLP75_13625 [Burkholderiales bacterium]|nr:hypothetical protein [Burkholderiales bacterium]